MASHSRRPSEPNLLNDETSQCWVSEDCPGRPLPGEANNERIYSREKKGTAIPKAEPVVEENPNPEPRSIGPQLMAVEVADHLKVHQSTVQLLLRTT
jgi:hypothetical protein